MTRGTTTLFASIALLCSGVIINGLPFFAHDTHAATGSSYIARADTTGLISNNNLATEQTLTYNTEVKTSPDITRQGGNQAFRIQNSGIYLIIANTRWDYTDISNNTRHVVRTQIKVGGTVLPSIYGMASGYGRNRGNANEDGSVVAALVDHTVVGGAGDDITFHVQNFGDTAEALADQIANQSGIQIIRLPGGTDYLRAHRTSNIEITGTLDFSTNDPTWNEFGWEVQDDETNSAVIEWVSGNDITLKEAGHYLVIYAAHSTTTTATHRRAVTYRLKLDDVEVPASRVLSYARQNDGATRAWAQWAGIIEASANGVLNIDWGSANETAGGTLEEAAITVARLPDTADYLRIRYDSNRAGETTGAFPFNQEDEDDANVHDNVTNNTRISGNSDNHDWLLFASWFLRTAAVDSDRVAEHFRWFRTGTEIQYGSGLSYHRGDQSVNAVPASGRNAIVVADSLGTGEYIELNYRQEATTGNQNRDFIANRVGITGVALDTLNTRPVATNVSIDSGASAITLTEGTTTNVVCNGTVTDNDGYTEITSVTANLYRTGSSLTGDDGLSPEIEMTEVTDGPNPSSAVFSTAYWISTSGIQSGRKLRARGSVANNRGTGIIASWPPQGGTISHDGSGGVTGTSFSFNIGTAGTDRLVAVMVGDENSGTSLTGVTVDGNACNKIAEADNSVGLGNHQEMWYCDEDDLGSSNGNVTVAITGGDTGWAIHTHLYTNVGQSGPHDFQTDNTSETQNEILPGRINIPEDGLLVFSAGNGQSGSYNNSDWDTSPTEGTTDENHYYQDVGDTECVPSGGSGISETYTCTFPVVHYAEPTDASSPFPSDNWTCDMIPSDAGGVGTTGSDTAEMNTLLAIDVTSTIDYGTLSPNTDTGGTNQVITITNTGNRQADPQLSGTDMSKGGDTIAVNQQKYAELPFTYSSGGTSLSSTPTTLDIDLYKQSTTTVITDTVYWGLGVPNGTAQGSYTGTNTITATTGS